MSTVATPSARTKLPKTMRYHHVRKVLNVSGYSKKAWKVAPLPTLDQQALRQRSQEVLREVLPSLMWVRSATTSLDCSVRQVWLDPHTTVQHHLVQSCTTKGQSPTMWSRALCTMSTVQTARQPTSERQSAHWVHDSKNIRRWVPRSVNRCVPIIMIITVLLWKPSHSNAKKRTNSDVA